MENAVKALLIAAAVIIAVLLISMVMGVFDKGSEQVQNTDLTEYEVKAFNEKFKDYEGNMVTGNDVNALLEILFSHNISKEDSTERIAVNAASGNGVPTKIEYKVANKPTASYPKVSTANKYTVRLGYNPKTGLVNAVTISGNK